MSFAPGPGRRSPSPRAGRRAALRHGAGRDAVVGARSDATSRCQARPFDAALLLPNSFHSALTGWRAGIPERWGYRTDFRGPLLTRGHHAARRLAPGFVLSAPRSRARLRQRTSETRAARPASGLRLRARRAAESRRGWDGARPLVAFAPGAAYGSAKRWPARVVRRDGAGVSRRWRGRRARRQPGRPRGRRRCDPAVGQGRCRSRSRGPDRSATAGRRARRTAARSSRTIRARLHLAAALGVPVTAIFGPTDERATHPLGRTAASRSDARGLVPAVHAARVSARLIAACAASTVDRGR